MKSQKGYRTAMHTIEGFESLTDDVATLEELEDEILGRVDRLPEKNVTRKELVRDIGFTESGLRILDKAGFLQAHSAGGARKLYSLKQALRMRLRFPGFTQAPQTRTIRKHSNITTVIKDTVCRQTDPQSLRRRSAPVSYSTRVEAEASTEE